MTTQQLITQFQKSGSFKGKSGKEYFFNMDALTLKKRPDFERVTLELLFSMELPTFFANIDKCADLTTPKNVTPENIFGVTHEANERLRNIQKGINHFSENRQSPVIQLIAMLCVEKGESNDYNIDMVNRKANDWEDIPYAFFLELSNHIVLEYGQITKKIMDLVGFRMKEDPK